MISWAYKIRYIFLKSTKTSSPFTGQQKKTVVSHSIFDIVCMLPWTSLVAQLVKNLPAMQGTPVSIPGSGRSPGEGIGYSFQYSWASLVSQTIKNLPALPET